jgi:beta-glucosidase
MTLDEKLSLMHGAADPEELGGAGYWPGLPRLGIPPLRFADGPSGINVNRDATALPAPVALAATFDTDAAKQYGIVLGREAAALRQDVVLAPHVNIVRDPLFRRNHTTLGEDPFLAAEIAAAEIRGIQSQGVMAQVKHLAGYNGAQNVNIDDRTLHEIYLPAFDAAVKAGVASVMCGYNQINGEWACENSRLQNDILRGQFGFTGFVTSDWGALHGPEALLRGVDLEMPGRAITGRGGPYFTTEELRAMPIEAVDRALGRLLEQMIRFGMLDGKTLRPHEIDVVGDARIARRVAAEGAVLLKNEGHVLPLKPADLNSTLLIGPTARQIAAGYLGERAYGFESRLISPLRAMGPVAYSPGVDLTGEPIPGNSRQGTLTVPEEGDYTFLVQPSEGEGSISIDGRVAATTSGSRNKKWSSLLPTTDGRDNGRGAPVHLTAGTHRVELDASPPTRFAWITPAMRRKGIAAAVAAAARAKTAIVFAWSETGTMELSEAQDELIARVAAAAPRTVVVLNSGGPVLMPWIGKVASVLEMWYPGQEGGWATADILMGRVNPAGRLPVNFPRRLEDTPAHTPGHPERYVPTPPPGMTGINADAAIATYSEGIAVGYRWYDQMHIEPLFPFGHGLSYTSFDYSNLSVSRTGVTFTLKNTGRLRGSEVAQVYAGSPTRSLAAFTRVDLDPGASRVVTLNVSSGPVFVGASSRDIRLSAALPK